MSKYSKYIEIELDKLIQKQDEFRNLYKIDSYSNWFYDSEFSLLRLYNNEQDEIYFKYIPLGTYSEKSKTWMWIWFNTFSIEKNKSKTLRIKNFGITNDYSKLIDGSFESDEYDALEFAAIGLSILGGIGIYKVNSNNLIVFMLITELVAAKDLEEINKLKQKKVECSSHGFSRPAFVCQHLNLEKKSGFIEAFETHKEMQLIGEDDSFQAWCDECEKIRIKYNLLKNLRLKDIFKKLKLGL